MRIFLKYIKSQKLSDILEYVLLNMDSKIVIEMKKPTLNIDFIESIKILKNIIFGWLLKIYDERILIFLMKVMKN